MNPTPTLPLPFIIFLLAIIAVFFASTAMWLTGAVFYFTKRQVLPDAEQETEKPWGLVDILLTIFLVIVLQLVVYRYGVAWKLLPPLVPKSGDALLTMACISSTQLIVVAIVTLFISLRCKIRASNIGWSSKGLGRDILYGVGAFVVAAPPVYIMMIAVTLVSGTKYEHPILEMVGKNSWMLLPAIWTAVFVAPITEEFGFRVLLQGYLQSLAKGNLNANIILFGRRMKPDESSSTLNAPLNVTIPEGMLLESRRASAEQQNPYSNSATSSLNENRVESNSNLGSERQPYWPIFVSGVVFGLMHYGYGMSWIPLSILGIILGWLYRQTNRIWPSLVVHFLLNLTSMIGFSLTVIYGDPSKLPLAP